MNPLNMASVTATAITGTFRQPFVVSPKLDNRQLATARGLSSDTAAQLKQMMRLTATGGTAQDAMRGLGGDIGAKTGSAEVDGQTKSDSWFTGFRNDVAAAAMTEEGGHGGDAAGPIVAQVLRAGAEPREGAVPQVSELTLTGRDSRVVTLVLVGDREVSGKAAKERKPWGTEGARLSATGRNPPSSAG